MKRTLNALLASLSLVAGTLLIAGPAAAADTFLVDKVHSDVSYQVRHILTKSRGRFTDFEGTFSLDTAKPEASTAAFAIKVASVDSGDVKRDAHLKSEDFFWAEKNAEITFKSTSIKSTGKDKYDVTGSFTMRGVTKVITLPVTFLGYGKDPWGNEKAGFETQVTLNRKDYGIVWNKALDTGGAILGDEVTVSINLELNKKKEPAAAKN